MSKVSPELEIDDAPSTPRAKPTLTEALPSVMQLIVPRAYLSGGTLIYRDLIRYLCYPSRPGAASEYETTLSAYLGVNTVLSYSSGRAALMEILRALEIGPGDEVLLPGYTCIVVPAAILAVGATPLYADIDFRTLNISPTSAAATITPRTKAILAQHTFGIPCDLESLTQIAESKGLFLIEDCAHALGAKIGSTYCGGHGAAAFFSTQQTKMISTIKGGIAATNHVDIAARLQRNHARLKSEPQHYADSRVGQWVKQTLTHDPRCGEVARKLARVIRRYSPLAEIMSRSADFETAEYEDAVDGIIREPARLAYKLAHIGLLQVGRIETDVIARNVIARSLEPLAMELGWRTPQIDWEKMRPSFVRFPFLVDDRAFWQQRLHQAGIEAGTWLNHPLHPTGSNYRKCGYEIGMCPNAEYAAKRVLNIPIHPRCADWIIPRLEHLTC